MVTLPLVNLRFNRVIFISRSIVLLGNSAYGCTLTNKHKYTDLTYHNVDERSISAIVNDHRFRGLEEVGENIIELERAKSTIRLDVPVQV